MNENGRLLVLVLVRASTRDPADPHEPCARRIKWDAQCGSLLMALSLQGRSCELRAPRRVWCLVATMYTDRCASALLRKTLSPSRMLASQLAAVRYLKKSTPLSKYETLANLCDYTDRESESSLKRDKCQVTQDGKSFSPASR